MQSHNDKLSPAKYREHINLLADVIEEEMEADEFTDVHGSVHEEVDNSEYITNTHYNLDVLRHARNDPDEFTHAIDDSMGYREVIQVLAYLALEQDLYEELHDREVQF